MSLVGVQRPDLPRLHDLDLVAFDRVTDPLDEPGGLFQDEDLDAGRTGAAALADADDPGRSIRRGLWVSRTASMVLSGIGARSS